VPILAPVDSGLVSKRSNIRSKTIVCSRVLKAYTYQTTGQQTKIYYIKTFLSFRPARATHLRDHCGAAPCSNISRGNIHISTLDYALTPLALPSRRTVTALDFTVELGEELQNQEDASPILLSNADACCDGSALQEHVDPERRPVADREAARGPAGGRNSGPRATSRTINARILPGQQQKLGMYMRTAQG